MEEYKGKAQSYEEVKLTALLAVLEVLGIEVKDELGIIKVFQDGKEVATIDISTPLATNSNK